MGMASFGAVLVYIIIRLHTSKITQQNKQVLHHRSFVLFTGTIVLLCFLVLRSELSINT